MSRGSGLDTPILAEPSRAGHRRCRRQDGLQLGPLPYRGLISRYDRLPGEVRSVEADRALAQILAPIGVARTETSMTKSKKSEAPDASAEFHRAAMVVYADLGELVRLLEHRGDLHRALLFYDEHVLGNRLRDPSDPPVVAELKDAVARLTGSLAMANKIAATKPRLARSLPGRGCLGVILDGSHHLALLSGAAEILEPDAEGAALTGRKAKPQCESGAIRYGVVRAVGNRAYYRTFGEHLQRELLLASLGDNPAMPTIASWQAAAAAWRRHIEIVPAFDGRPPKVMLDLSAMMPPPRDGISTCSSAIVTDPPDQVTPEARLRLANDPAVGQFAELSLELARASKRIAADLEHRGIDGTAAIELGRELHEKPHRPSAAVAAMLGKVDLLVTRLAVSEDREEDIAEPETRNDQPCFIQSDDAWIVEFEGVRKTLKHLQGMHYIHALLSHPGEPQPTAALDGADRQWASSQQAIIDDTTLGAIRDRLTEIEEELQEATADCDEGLVQTLSAEKASILQQVRLTSFQGRQRTMKSPMSAATNRVKSGIRRALKHIEKVHPAAGKHLRECIQAANSSRPCYHPPHGLVWRL